VTWTLIFAKHTQKVSQKLVASGLKSASSAANRQGAAHVVALRMNRALNALIGASAPIEPTSV
jgi:hypothetical protein